LRRAPRYCIVPRVVRLRDAPEYLGMDKDRFKAEVRPYLTEIPIGAQGIAFDRVDLDEWFENYKSSNGRPGKAMKGGEAWGRRSRQDLLSTPLRKYGYALSVITRTASGAHWAALQRQLSVGPLRCVVLPSRYGDMKWRPWLDEGA
jgi:hypothetical protein